MPRLVLVVTITAVFSGMAGMVLALLLHAIQHLAYGYGLDRESAVASFLSGVESASPLRRLAVMALAGCIAGIGWFMVYRSRMPLVPVKSAVNENLEMPLLPTLCHALLQIVTVAMGSPLGREVAPREVGALIGFRLSRAFGLSDEQRRWIIAGGAGTGLAAVYNVPLAGAVFTLEVLLCSFDRRPAAIALFMSALGALVASVGLGHGRQYALPDITASTWLNLWALLCGPAFGIAARSFREATASAKEHSPKNLMLILSCPLGFSLIGALAVFFPELLGNGRGPVQLGFSGQLSFNSALVLLLLKSIVICVAMRAGASGGLLTPGLACGTMVGIAYVLAWNSTLPQISITAAAVIGAAAFLGTSMRMPVTAVILICEFTHLPYETMPALVLAVCGSVFADRLLDKLSPTEGGASPATFDRR